MKPGQSVTVIDAWGNKLKRKVVSVSERKIYVCKPEELKNSLYEHRVPNAIGFSFEHIIASAASSE